MTTLIEFHSFNTSSYSRLFLFLYSTSKITKLDRLVAGICLDNFELVGMTDYAS